jgi:hypothetical protein
MTTEPTVMMPSSFGLELSVDGGTTYDPILEVTGFDLGNIEADENDVTSFSSAGDFREFKNGLKQASDGSFTINYLIGDEQHIALRDQVGDADPVKLRATATAANADDEIVTFDALIKGMSKPIEIGGVLVATVSFKLTGAPIYSATP